MERAVAGIPSEIHKYTSRTTFQQAGADANAHATRSENSKHTHVDRRVLYRDPPSLSEPQPCKRYTTTS